jgi:hypothetical protein
MGILPDGADLGAAHDCVLRNLGVWGWGTLGHVEEVTHAVHVSSVSCRTGVASCPLAPMAPLAIAVSDPTMDKVQVKKCDKSISYRNPDVHW